MKRLLCLLFFLYLADAAGQAINKQGHPGKLPNSVTVNWAQRIKQGFSMWVWLSNQMTMGGQAWDVDEASTPNGMGLEYPAGSGMEHLYGAGPWLGGIVNGRPLVSEGYNGDDARKELRPEYHHLPREHFWRTAVGSTAYDPLGYDGYYYNNHILVNRRGCDDDGDGKVDEDDLDGFDNDGDWNLATDDVGADGLPDSLEASCNGLAYDPVSNPDPAGDDYNPAQLDKCHPLPDGSLPLKSNKDLYTEGNGIPDHGEPHVDEDYGAISDNDLYCSATDTGTYQPITSQVPMGIKVVQKSYAWKSPLGEALLPFDYYFIDVGRNVIKQVYIGFFADMDVGPTDVGGFYLHNYAAYNDTLRMAYIHNPVDRGSTPLGLMLLRTPRPLNEIKHIFQWFDFTTRIGPGTIDSLIYDWMSGREFQGQEIWPNQPLDKLSDTRFLYSFGPFADLNPGDTLRISIALVSGFAVSTVPNSMIDNAQKVLAFEQRGYTPPVAPPSPGLTAEEGNGKIVLRWGHRAGMPDPRDVWDDSNKLAESEPDTSWRRYSPPCGIGSGGCGNHTCVIKNGKPYLPGGRVFAGYRLYRYECQFPGTPDDRSFGLVREFRLQDMNGSMPLGLDTMYVDSPIVPDHIYWYAVTSFSIGDIAVLPIPMPTGVVRYDTLYIPGMESGIAENRIRVDLPFSASDKSGQVLVVPNPYRGDRRYTTENGGWEGPERVWTPDKEMIKFIHLPRKCTIRIFTLAGDIIATIQYQAPPSTPNAGEAPWNLKAGNGEVVASGLYIFTVESDLGVQRGKFVIIK